MAKYYLHLSIYILLLVGLVLSSCNGQLNTSSSKETTNLSKPNPEVITTPPPLVSLPDPYNDTSLVASILEVCIRTGPKICGGVQDKDSIDLTANAFVKLKEWPLVSVVA